LTQRRKLSVEEKRKYISLRRNFAKPVIGVTGYLGKTTTIHMLQSLLATRGNVLNNSYSQGSWANNIKTLEKLSPCFDYALFEFDYDREKNFVEILRLIKPTIGIVTNIGDAHLSYLGGVMKIALQKSEVVNYLARNGLAILNKDDELCSALVDYISTKNVIKYGLSQNADYYATDIEQLGHAGTRFLLNGKHKVTIPVYSISDVYNFLAATAAAVNLDFTIPEIIDIFQQTYTNARGRGRLLKAGNHFIIDECYVGTPRSVSKAARSLVGFKNKAKKLIMIVGDMTESGVNIEDRHLNMGYFLSALPIDCLITVGQYAEYIARGARLIQANKKKVISVHNIDELLDTVDDLNDKSMVICLKGVGTVACHRIYKLLEQEKVDVSN
jgi:UDP-N-acetylmuramyl pentapeptide synthase